MNTKSPTTLAVNDNLSAEEKVFCPYEKNCSGCQYLHLTYQEQKNLKTQELKQLFVNKDIFVNEIEFLSSGEKGLRDRLDFSLQGGRLGLYGKGLYDIIDLEVCPQLSPPLQQWLTEFRRIEWPVEKGSIRLRVGPQGQRGVWLDFANVDIKKILMEKNLLQKLQALAFVEMGQRRKIPVLKEGVYKLEEPELYPWFETWMNDQAVPLYCHVASFTQPSLKANQLISRLISDWVGLKPQSRWIEFGSGIGNLTLPALVTATKILACEIDELSLQGLEKTLVHLPESLKHHKDKLTIFRGDFQRKILQDFSQFDGILANPPRSGLMGFLDPLGQLSFEQRPDLFIYMSCYPESMVSDLVKLKDWGYTVKRCVILDQFPQSTHYEVFTLLQRH